MQKRMIAGVEPIKTSLKEGGEYFFCTCGRAKTQPFCDGSHKGTSFVPMKFTAKATTQKWLCACKHTGNPPYCDGTHQRFAQTDIGTIPE